MWVCWTVGWQSKEKSKKWLHAIAIEAIPYMTKEALVEVRVS